MVLVCGLDRYDAALVDDDMAGQGRLTEEASAELRVRDRQTGEIAEDTASG
ncbi:hypothetical protein [Streptomyces bobili]|uniref:hypothetical protein n=1 Tax=Streptomyces bobili TaxID=67280 RepID=UPI00382C454E